MPQNYKRSTTSSTARGCQNRNKIYKQLGISSDKFVEHFVHLKFLSRMETINELLQFMQPNQRLDLKAVSLTHVLGLTGAIEGRSAILTVTEMLVSIFGLTSDANHTIAKDAVLVLINLTAEEAGAIKVYETAKELEPPFALVKKAVKNIIDENSDLADAWSMVLSNLTRVEFLVSTILSEIEEDNDKTIGQLATAFAKLNYNKKKQKLDYLGPIFCNLSQTSRGREILCRSRYNILDKIVPFASFNESLLRRGGTIGIFKNICFDIAYHDIVLGENSVIFSAILYPLSGPESLTDEENDMLPIELQYLPDSKKREEDPDLRKMLLECLLQLCATKRYREVLRAKGTYEILREYHKWEAKVGKDKDCILACENVVDILIRKESEIEYHNIKEVDVPADITEKFVKEDADYLKDLL